MDKLILLFSLNLLLPNLGLAAPALGGEQTLTQPDGTTFTATLSGDEHLNWLDLGNGYIAKYNKLTGFYDYGVIFEGNRITTSNIPVSEQTNTALTDPETNSFGASSSPQISGNTPSGEIVEVTPVTNKQLAGLHKKIKMESQIEISDEDEKTTDILPDASEEKTVGAKE